MRTKKRCLIDQELMHDASLMARQCSGPGVLDYISRASGTLTDVAATGEAQR
jgi:hypothetical protein